MDGTAHETGRTARSSVDRVRREFMPGFERLLAGQTKSKPSFSEKDRARWRQQVSDRPDIGAAQ